MKMTFKTIISMVIIVTMSFAITSVAYASDVPENSVDCITISSDGGTTAFMVDISENGDIAFSTTSGETLHKINGTGTTTGGPDSYTSTTTRTCNKIKAMGEVLTSTQNKEMQVIVLKGTEVVASGQIQLNGQYYELTKFLWLNYPAATYTIQVTPFFSGGYEVSTYFYY